MIILRRKREIIGRGGHWDKIASKAIDLKQERENSDVFISECGLGASGLPHIGSFADASRAYAVKVAVEDTGLFETKFIAYADDLDGLRKVPAGLPEELEEWIGVPVTRIPDPTECHESYGYHMVYLLLDSLNRANIEYVHKSASDLYERGLLVDQIRSILCNTDRVGEIIKEETGQTKYLQTIPYHPICKQCNRIYTTTVTGLDLDRNIVEYTCRDTQIGTNAVVGCNHQGIVDFTQAEGKLNWKTEFAARWAALEVDFEPYGKDILESVMTNNRICKEILNYLPPYQIRYEMFLDKGGHKISKSAGNVLTPQMWFEYGSPQSLILMTLKRIEGSRNLSVDVIPQYMEELLELEALYHNLVTERNEIKKIQLRALYEYCWWLSPPQDFSLATDGRGRYNSIPYNLVSHLSQFAPKTIKTKVFVRKQLEDYQLIQTDQDWERVSRWINYPIKWSQEQENSDFDPIELSNLEIKVIEDIIIQLQNIEFEPDRIQMAIFDSIKKYKLKPREFFPLLYQIFLNIDYGPRIGKVLSIMGRKIAISRLKSRLQ